MCIAELMECHPVKVQHLYTFLFASNYGSQFLINIFCINFIYMQHYTLLIKYVCMYLSATYVFYQMCISETYCRAVAKVFMTGQAKRIPEHYLIICMGSWYYSLKEISNCSNLVYKVTVMLKRPWICNIF